MFFKSPSHIMTVVMIVLCIFEKNYLATIAWGSILALEILNVIHEDYIKWLEKDRDHWHNEFIKEKYGIDLKN